MIQINVVLKFDSIIWILNQMMDQITGMNKESDENCHNK